MFYQISEGHKIINEGPKPETDLERLIRELEQDERRLAERTQGRNGEVLEMNKEKWQRFLLVLCGVSALTFGFTFGITLCRFDNWSAWTTYNCIGTVGAGLYCLYASVKGLI